MEALAHRADFGKVPPGAARAGPASKKGATLISVLRTGALGGLHYYGVAEPASSARLPLMSNVPKAAKARARESEARGTHGRGSCSGLRRSAVIAPVFILIAQYPPTKDTNNNKRISQYRISAL